jgi:hypothetical protein
MFYVLYGLTIFLVNLKFLRVYLDGIYIIHSNIDGVGQI